jgi:hypothetical protein
MLHIRSICIRGPPVIYDDIEWQPKQFGASAVSSIAYTCNIITAHVSKCMAYREESGVKE